MSWEHNEQAESACIDVRQVAKSEVIQVVTERTSDFILRPVESHGRFYAKDTIC